MKIINCIAFLLLCIVNMNAQVTIGRLANPHEAAVLDLSQVELHNLGLLLPRVKLESLDSFDPLPEGNKSTAAGMVVYNEAPVDDEVYPGIYVWDGAKWGRINDGTAPPPPIGPTATVNYTDKTSETVSLPASNAPFVLSNGTSSDGTEKTIHDITLEDGTKYLIGRKVADNLLYLNLASDGVLDFRTAEDGTILIGSYAEFQLIYGLDELDNKYKLEADLDLMNEEWTPIAVKEGDGGGGTLTESFYGIFDGGDFKIENLQIDKSGSGVSTNQSMGLFEKNKGTIINVHVVSGTITGKGYGGGICGVNAGGSIKKCSNGAMITTTENYAGGITGQNTAGGTINACYNTGAITGGNYVGGVAGYNSKDTNVSFITACYNTGDVTGNSNVGGVVGYNTGSFITACYNTGDVTGTVNHIGGVAGYNDGSIITACYNIGDVTGTGTKKNIGSVVGNNISSNNANKIVACYTKKKVQVTGIAVPGTLFSGDAGAWPLETTNDAWKLYHNGGYWKSLGNWNDGWEGNTPTELPKLWFE
jgi:hypothetical protein